MMAKSDQHSSLESTIYKIKKVMNDIFNNYKTLNFSDLTPEGFYEFTLIYDDATKLAMEVIVYIWKNFGLIISAQDLNEIENLFPKKSNYKEWDIENFKSQLSVIKSNLIERGEHYSEFMNALADDDKYVTKESEHFDIVKHFPFYQEFIERDE